MKDLNETLQRKCGVSLIYIQADLIFFLDQLDLPQGYNLFIFL